MRRGTETTGVRYICLRYPGAEIRMSRDHRIVIYLDDDELETLEMLCSVEGMDRPQYIRRVLMRADECSTSSHAAPPSDDEYSMAIMRDALEDSRESRRRLEQLLAQSQTTALRVSEALPAPRVRRWWRPW